MSAIIDTKLLAHAAPFFRAGKPIELTVADYAGRGCVSDHSARGRIKRMIAGGVVKLADRNRADPTIHIYSLTEVGEAAAAAFIAGDYNPEPEPAKPPVEDKESKLTKLLKAAFLAQPQSRRHSEMLSELLLNALTSGQTPGRA
ncbi:hypothetical protein SAMN04489859_102029 [Paracoccus alcaliphilus]|uniref:Uncharacterized protein n=1 Tax=Paracoccus alcaliphilus TaxID=34002 RepID=A0A1H8K4M8_9RHOB|nr:hypothetical protein [Paracoccus alcaliphilus]WCR17526.1 hypothetical protein JHW40_14480 [Paracoccus alcaliphilus]SEN87368.1 hypothetical protein SAMN04489859_102029 [Paracoccus alcaliphilus]